MSTPGDPSEREADRVADAVVAGAGVPTIGRGAQSTVVSRKCPACESAGALCPKCRDDQVLQRQHDGHANTSGTGFSPRLGGGAALPTNHRQFYESRMGHDFADVRIHTDAAAHASAQSIGARAYTLENNIAFAQGEYDPHSERGRHLLGHELTHVVQQRGGPRTVQRSPGPREAEIQRSRVSPGRITGTRSPASFSLYNFAINEASLKTRHYDFLDEFAHLVITGVIANVRLQGHADSTGDDTINHPLSSNRAAAVRDYLALLGVSVTGVGSSAASSPVASNASEAGRSRNRRVDISFDLVRRPTPEPDTGDQDKPPPDGGQPPPGDTGPPPGPEWPDVDFPCADYPIICGIIGVGVFCALFPEVCAMGIPWPDIPWPGWPDFDDSDEPPEPPEEPESEHQCGDPQLPLTHVQYFPPSGDKGNRVVAEPLTRCEGNKHGSHARRWNPNWPHGWDCVRQQNQSHLWARAHLLHGPTLHGPGNERENIIIADKSINGKMSTRVEQPAIGMIRADQVLWYEVSVNHMSGDYPRPYFAESVNMSYGPLDPITRVRGPALFDAPISSDTHRVPPDCETTTDPPDDTVPPVVPTPDGDTPGPAGLDDNVTCDRDELARRVDACVEEARQGAIECTLGALISPGVGGSIGYLLCLEDVRRRLLECDHRAKADTHCPDSAPPALPAPEEDSGTSFDSTLQICHRLLDSRVFHVASGRVEVLIDANWRDESGAVLGAGACPTTGYHVSLEKVGLVFDSEISTGDVSVGTPTRLTWSGLESGDYYLKIWTNNSNPNCCLTGTISVSTGAIAHA